MFIKRWRFFQNISSKKLDRAALAELEEERRLKEKREKEERRRKELTEELCSQTREGRVVIACRDKTRFFNYVLNLYGKSRVSSGTLPSKKGPAGWRFPWRPSAAACSTRRNTTGAVYWKKTVYET